MHGCGLVVRWLACLDGGSSHNFLCLEVCLLGKNSPPLLMRYYMFKHSKIVSHHIGAGIVFLRKKLQGSPFKPFAPHFIRYSVLEILKINISFGMEKHKKYHDILPRSKLINSTLSRFIINV
jgi:hypothetical protein